MPFVFLGPTFSQTSLRGGRNVQKVRLKTKLILGNTDQRGSEPVTHL